MKTGAMLERARKVGYIVALVVGLGLGGVVPTLADTEPPDAITVCDIGRPAPSNAWAPPQPGRRGEPY